MNKTQTTPIPAIEDQIENIIQEVIMNHLAIPEGTGKILKLFEASRKEVLEEELIWIRKQSLKSSRGGVLGYDFVGRLEKRLEQKIYGELQALGTEEQEEGKE